VGFARLADQVLLEDELQVGMVAAAAAAAASAWGIYLGSLYYVVYLR